MSPVSSGTRCNTGYRFSSRCTRVLVTDGKDPASRTTQKNNANTLLIRGSQRRNNKLHSSSNGTPGITCTKTETNFFIKKPSITSVGRQSVRSATHAPLPALYPDRHQYTSYTVHAVVASPEAQLQRLTQALHLTYPAGDPVLSLHHWD